MISQIRGNGELSFSNRYATQLTYKGLQGAQANDQDELPVSSETGGSASDVSGIAGVHQGQLAATDVSRS